MASVRDTDSILNKFDPAAKIVILHTYGNQKSNRPAVIAGRCVVFQNRSEWVPVLTRVTSFICLSLL